jgi:hypothetical protein
VPSITLLVGQVRPRFSMCRRSNAMFFMLARNRMSKASPTTGTEPITVSSKVLANMRAISHLGAPSCRASQMR